MLKKLGIPTLVLASLLAVVPARAGVRFGVAVGGPVYAYPYAAYPYYAYPAYPYGYGWYGGWGWHRHWHHGYRYYWR